MDATIKRATNSVKSPWGWININVGKIGQDFTISSYYELLKFINLAINYGKSYKINLFEVKTNQKYSWNMKPQYSIMRTFYNNSFC